MLPGNLAGMDSEAPTPTVTTSAGAGAGVLPTDWPARAADTIEDVVAAVRDRVVRPLLVAVRALVYGALVATGVLVVTVLLAVAVVRILDVYAFGTRVWASDLVVGGVITGAGLWLRWRARSRPEEA